MKNIIRILEFVVILFIMVKGFSVTRIDASENVEYSLDISYKNDNAFVNVICKNGEKI